MRGQVLIGVVVAAVAVASLGCHSQGKGRTVDTTKEVYSDEEAPKEQIYVVNGVATAIPWNQTDPEERWFVEYEETSTAHKFRVPIVRIEITSVDRQGRPVPREDGYEVNGMFYGLNPNHVMHVYYGHAH